MRVSPAPGPGRRAIGALFSPMRGTGAKSPLIRPFRAPLAPRNRQAQPAGRSVMRGPVARKPHALTSQAGEGGPRARRPILTGSSRPACPLFGFLAQPAYTQRVLRRELYLFSLYRLLEASLLALLVFGPGELLAVEPHNAALAVAASLAYLPASLLLFVWARRPDTRMSDIALVGVCTDVLVAMVVSHAIPSAGPGVAMMLLFNLAAAALFLRLPVSVAVAAFASLAMLVEFVWARLDGANPDRPLAELLMFIFSFFAVVTLTHLLGERMRASQDLADQRGAEAENLAGINELIIRRMRTGVLMVDGSGHVRLANEAAQRLYGDGDLETRRLADLSAELASRLRHWLVSGESDDSPMPYGNERLEVQPRFTRLLTGSDTVLVFLDDASMVSRRAESLTLSAMGRFSASLAHEIRNPLAAISYSVQLLEESTDIPDSERRLLEIIRQQCQRTNGIVDSVLGLARRERAIGEQLELVSFVRRFVDEFSRNLAPENGTLRTAGRERPLTALFDPGHLQQILTILAQNALNYGRLPGEPARITMAVDECDGRPCIDVADRGPGVPDAVASQLGRPFFTTSAHGTGLGLYIARELSLANGGHLDYVPVPGGGACFRIALPGRSTLLHNNRT